MTALETTLERKLEERLPASKLTRLPMHLLIIPDLVDLMTQSHPVDAILRPHGPSGVRQVSLSPFPFSGRVWHGSHQP
jgi:hypothetical protein